MFQPCPIAAAFLGHKTRVVMPLNSCFFQQGRNLVKVYVKEESHIRGTCGCVFLLMYLILVQTSFLHLVETLATFIASVHSWSFSPSIATLMGGLPAPLGYFAVPAMVWFLPDYSTSHWSCVTRAGGGQLPEGYGAGRSIDWPCDLSNKRAIVILTLLSSLFSCSSRLRFICLSWSHIPSCSYFVLSLSFWP